MTTIAIQTPYIKLDALLKFAALCSSGGEAKAVIQEGLVSVNGEICVQRGKKIIPGDTVAFSNTELTVTHEN